MKKYKYIILINIFLILIFLYAICIFIYNLYIESKIPYKDEIEGAQKLSTSLSLVNITNTKNAIQVVEKDAEETKKTDNISNNQTQTKNNNIYNGYGIIAKLVIPKINLTTDVIGEYTKEALLVSVTKFWGPNPNEIGNFCISGHNYQNKNMFSNLKKLEVGDEMLLTDNNNNTVKYIVYDVFKVKPEDTSSASQKTNGKREVTLITCTNDSLLRIIVKAREEEKL